MSVSSARLTKHDLGIWIATAIGLVGLRRLSPVAVAGGGQRETRLEVSLSESDLWRAMEPLRLHARAEATQLGDRIRSLEPRLSRRSIIVVISDLHDPMVGSSLRHVAQKHDVVVVHLEDPAERGKLRAGFFRGVEAETGRMFLGGGTTQWRGEPPIVQELVGAGISYLHLRTDRPFIPPLRHFLASRNMMSRSGN